MEQAFVKLKDLCSFYFDQGNDSLANKATNGSIGWIRSKTNETTALSWGNMLSWFTSLDFKVLFSVVKENLGILMSVSM
jgi:hypothetical protein